MPYSTLLPIAFYFGIGLLLRVTGFANRDHASFVFRLVYFVTLPALVFVTISQKDLTRGSVLLPLAGFFVDLVCAAAAASYARFAKLGSRQAGALILGASITNMVFMFPFILAVLGTAALADALLYDIGNGVFVATVAVAISARYGGLSRPTIAGSLLRVARSPLFIALAAALVVSVGKLAVPPLLFAALSPLAEATIPLTLIGLGLVFSVAHLPDRLPFYTLSLRMAAGLVAGVSIAWIFGFEGTTALVVIACAAAPVGFNSLTLSSIGRLDTERAAAALSLSIAIGFVTAPLLLYAGSRFG